jgi:hypothetical protein
LVILGCDRSRLWQLLCWLDYIKIVEKFKRKEKKKILIARKTGRKAPK